MATYTVTINEKTRHGKGLVAYLRSLGVIDEPNETTLKAIDEIMNGEVTRCNSFEEYLDAVK